MIACIYLILITYFGDRISRQLFRFVSIPHRLATSFLIGLVLATVITYLGSLAFSWFARPLLIGNLIFLAVAFIVIYTVPRKQDINNSGVRPLSNTDWITLTAILLFASWLMFATLNFRQGKFLISFKGWTDFGANLSLLQSLVLGHNFPTQHPFFPGEPIRYHFLFWFQTANLEFLGLNPIWSINLLSILSLLALLILVMTLAELLFRSAAVGPIASLLFFFSSSLYYLSFLGSQGSIRGALTSIVNRTDFLPSGYPFRGEDWGVLTISVFGYQRHLISGICLLLVVIIFLVDRYQAKRNEALRLGPTQETEPRIENSGHAEVGTIDHPLLRASIFSGLLIGLLPFWNSPSYVASLAILGCLFVLFPYRIYLGSLLATAILIGLPQLLLFKPRTLDQPLLHWSYTMDNPTVIQVLKYLGWSFGFKWLLILVALILISNAHRKLFLAFSSLLVLVFFFQLSTDAFNNHKLLNIWAIFASVYAAYGLWRIAKSSLIGAAAACILALATTLSGIIDLFPIQNDPAITVPYRNDRLTTWLLANTKPSDVFLSQTLLSHPILFSGRKIFLGNTLYAWSAGYPVAEREIVYRRMFEERDPNKLKQLLHQNGITYVAIDSGVRSNPAIKHLNEAVYRQHFQIVFDDTERQYDFVTIYKVPATSEVAQQQGTVSP